MPVLLTQGQRPQKPRNQSPGCAQPAVCYPTIGRSYLSKFPFNSAADLEQAAKLGALPTVVRRGVADAWANLWNRYGCPNACPVKLPCGNRPTFLEVGYQAVGFPQPNGAMRPLFVFYVTVAREIRCEAQAPGGGNVQPPDTDWELVLEDGTIVRPPPGEGAPGPGSGGQGFVPDDSPGSLLVTEPEGPLIAEYYEPSGRPHDPFHES